MMNKKGQGAMEYLMTYGWAILVVIIVGIVLWQSGVFGTGGGGTSGFTKIRIEDYAVNSTGDAIQISYENAAGQSLRTVDITYTLSNGSSYSSTDWAGGAGDTWAPGKEYADTTYPGDVCGDAGAGYTVDITIAYTSEANIAHSESGTIRGTCE